MQLAQQQLLRIHRFHQILPRCEIWFGTRGSEVQILSPRPILSNYLQCLRKPENQPSGVTPDFASCNFLRNRINTALPLFYAVQHRLQNRPQRCDGKTRCSTNRKPLNCKGWRGAPLKRRDGVDSHKGAKLEPKVGDRCDEKTRRPSAEDT